MWAGAGIKFANRMPIVLVVALVADPRRPEPRQPGAAPAGAVPAGAAPAGREQSPGNGLSPRFVRLANYQNAVP
jgi:hypothetical protein